MKNKSSYQGHQLSRSARILLLMVPLTSIAVMGVNVAFQVFPIWVSAIAVVPAVIGTVLQGRLTPSDGAASHDVSRTSRERAILRVARTILMAVFLASSIIYILSENHAFRTVAWAVFLSWTVVMGVNTILSVARAPRRG